MAQMKSGAATEGKGISATTGDNRTEAGSEGRAQKQGPRKRVSQACDKCRARKDKCDGKRPVGDVPLLYESDHQRDQSCSTCISNHRECAYDANVKKRGLPEGYVRGLEKLWGLAIRDISEIEQIVLSTLVVGEKGTENSLRVWNDETTSEVLVEIWRKSKIWRELERLLSSQEPAVDSKRKRTVSDIGAAKRIDHGHSSEDFPDQPSSDGNGTVIDEWHETHQQLNDIKKAPSSSGIDRPGTYGITEYESILSPSYDNATNDNSIALQVLEPPELPSESWNLFDVWFSYSHPWFPILEKHDLLKASYQYSRNRGTTNTHSGDNAVLWATIAYAKFQHRAINNIPRALGAVGKTVWTAERMYSQARSLIPIEEGCLELGHVQALLILSLANIGSGLFNRAWSLIGQAVRVAIDLHLDRSHESISSVSQTRSRSKHVFLGCFVLDTLISARLGRKPHLRHDDVEKIGSIDEDGLEEWDPWVDALEVRRNRTEGPRLPTCTLSTFNQLVSILQVLNEAICLPLHSTSFQRTILIEKLQMWGRSITPPVGSDPASMTGKQSLLPHQIHVRQTYFITMATLQMLEQEKQAATVVLTSISNIVGPMIDLLHTHSLMFGLLIVPPTYEYIVETAYKIICSYHDGLNPTPTKIDEWKHRLDSCLESLVPAWPVLEMVKPSGTYQALLNQGETQSISDLLVGSQDTDAPMTCRSPLSSKGYHLHGVHRSKTPKPQSSATQPMRPHAQKQVERTLAHLGSFEQSSANGMPQNPLAIYQNAHAAYGNLNSSTTHNVAPILAPLSQPFSIPTQIEPSQHRSLTMSSTDADVNDPILNELMRLDTTEWAGNSYQALVNLGFSDTNPADMDQDFQAFCQDPDPLSQSNLFQHLVNGVDLDVFDDVGGGLFDGLPTGLGLEFDAFDGQEGRMNNSDDSMEEVGQILATLRES